MPEYKLLDGSAAPRRFHGQRSDADGSEVSHVELYPNRYRVVFRQWTGKAPVTVPLTAEDTNA